MTTFPGSPRLLRGGIVLVDPETAAVQRIIALQYNPKTLSRSLEVQSVQAEGADRSEALRLTGPAVETITLNDVEIDATDQLEFPDQYPNATQFGIQPQLAALETMLYPSSAQLQDRENLAQAGTLEIAPMEAPLPLFIWGKNRVLPVRITSFSITEEEFDPNLNPIRAKISLGMRVLNVDDLSFDHKGGSLFMSHLQQKERLAAKSPDAAFSTFGIGGIP